MSAVKPKHVRTGTGVRFIYESQGNPAPTDQGKICFGRERQASNAELRSRFR